MIQTTNEYTNRLKRIRDSVALKEPDRVPLVPQAQTYPILRYSHTMAEALYDASCAADCIKKYLLEYEPDMGFDYGSIFAGMGPVMDAIGLTYMQWAGEADTKIDKNSIHQYIEKAYLSEEDFPTFVKDMDGWVRKVYIPQCYEKLKGFAKINFSGLVGFGFSAALMQFADPEIMEAMKTVMEVAPMIIRHNQNLAHFRKEIIDLGFPVQNAATITSAYDMLSDNLRGTMGIMTDMYDQPEVVEDAIEMIYPKTLAGLKAQLAHAQGEWVFVPLHKGMDGFLSDEHYREFYWKPLKKLILEIIDAGFTPYVFTEGKYDSRLPVLADPELPEGKIVFHFEDVDLKEAKRIVGAHNCIMGGFNARLLETGTVGQVKDEVKRILDICAPGGGYIFDVNDTMDDCKPENVEAMFETVKVYGKY